MSDQRRRFEAVALPHLDAAYSLARWLCRSPSDADDIVQDAMLRAFRGFERLRGEDARPWLLSIVRNCWRDRAAQSRRRGHVPLPTESHGPELAFDGIDAETQAVRDGEARRLRAAIAALPDDYREVLVLREMEDFSYRQIADAIGAPIGTVMSRLARARAALKDKWMAEERHALR